MHQGIKSPCCRGVKRRFLPYRTGDSRRQNHEDEADEEHHVAKFLVAELEKMSGSEDHFEAKFKSDWLKVSGIISGRKKTRCFPRQRKPILILMRLGEELLARKEETVQKKVFQFWKKKNWSEPAGINISMEKNKKIYRNKKSRSSPAYSRNSHASSQRTHPSS